MVPDSGFRGLFPQTRRRRQIRTEFLRNSRVQKQNWRIVPLLVQTLSAEPVQRHGKGVSDQLSSRRPPPYSASEIPRNFQRMVELVALSAKLSYYGVSLRDGSCTLDAVWLPFFLVVVDFGSSWSVLFLLVVAWSLRMFLACCLLYVYTFSSSSPTVLLGVLKCP